MTTFRDLVVAPPRPSAARTGTARPWAGSAAACVAAAALLAAPGSAGAETSVSAYLGASFTLDSDVALRLDDDGTNLTFDDVSWDDESFEDPPYYGLRLTHYFDQAPRLGLALDFVHYKMYADLDDGELGETFDVLNFSHGMNLLTLNGLYRWNADASAAGGFLDRLQPYVGLGAGVAIPHVEVRLADADDRTYEYQFVGPAAQALAGVNVVLARHWALFGEYRFSYADVEADLEEGGDLQTDALTHHLTFGVSFRF